LLKNQPLARLAFLLYLALVHIWLFTVLSYSVHNFELEHGDFGSYRHHDQPHLPGYKMPGAEGEEGGG